MSRGTQLNKAGYTAIPVTCGWAGAVFDVNQSGLFLERAREPVALYFAVGLSCFTGSEPGGLSHFWLDTLD